MEKYLAKIQPKHYGVVAFVLTCLAMYVMFSYEEVLSTGRYIIMEGDLYQQYVPFIRMLVRDILQGEYPWFSWSLSMGMNTSLCYAYYALSPFNLLYLVLYHVDENIVTAIVIILKTGLASFLFQRFAATRLKCTGAESIIFSISYAMCSYQLIYNVLNIAWIDALYILPLLCSLLISFVKEEKWKGLAITYTYLFITQFYMAYIVGIFSVLFLVCVIICNAKIKLKQLICYAVKYAGIVMLAIGMAATVWLPAIMFLLKNTVPTDESVMLELNIFHIIKNMLWGQMQGIDGIYPYLYCGVWVLILIPLFFENKRIALKERICGLVLLIIMLCCMLIEPLYLFMHAFDVPNQLGFRFAFLGSFLFCCIGGYQYANMEKHYTGSMIYILGTEILLYVAAIIVTGANCAAITEWLKLAATVVFVGLWLVCMWFLEFRPQKKNMLAVVCIFLIVVETASNGYVCFQHVGPEKPERLYNTYRDSIDYAMKELKSDDDFYRVIYLNDDNDNSDSWFGYNGLTDFSSAINVKHQETMRNLGHIADGNVNYPIGATPVTRMLFGVKYIINGIHPNMLAVEMPKPTITQCQEVLSLGYMVDSKVLDYTMPDNRVFDNLDMLLTCMTGEETDCFCPISDEQITVTEENATLTYADQCFTICRNSENEDSGYITYRFDGDANQAVYVQFLREHVYYSKQSPVLLGGDENNIENKGHLTASYAKELIFTGKTYEVTVEIGPEHVPMIRYTAAEFFEFNQEELRRAYDILSRNQMSVTEYGNGYVKGNVTVPQDKPLLFTSIPYDEGWKAYVDGIEVKPCAVVGNAFLALELEPGEHDLEFSYVAPGVKEGIAISVVSLGIFALLSLNGYIRKRKEKEGTVVSDVKE